MKFIKGVALSLVLSLAAFGAYTLLKKPPQLDVSDSDISYLQDLGIHIQNGQASDSGLSSILDVEGVTPVGASTETSSSSTPPGFFADPATSYADPFETAPSITPASPFEAAPPFESAPFVATAITTKTEVPLTLPPVQEFSSPEAEILPPPNLVEPASGQPASETPLSEVPPFEAPPVPLSQATPPDQSSPPVWKSWDGPSSDISVTPPPAEPLQTSSPAAPPAEVFPPANEHIASPPVVKTIHRITSDSTAQGPSPSATDNGFSTKNNIPLGTVSQSTPSYTRTSVRQQLTFAPAKPEIRPNAPVVSFGHPKRYSQSQQPLEKNLPPSITASQSTIPNNPPALSENSGIPSPAHEMVKQFVESQQQLIASGSPENVRHAFIQLSQLYEHNMLGEPERAMIQPILDSLALKIIYAKDSCILEPLYRVKPGETVGSIARDFNLTPPLLRKMNGLAISQELPVGSTLKVVYGQFDARVSLKRRELTLLLGGLYAGRFTFSLPQAGLPAYQGEFFVTNRTNRSIVLNNGWILATASEPNATIIFADKDAQEIFDILSEQSVVVLE